MSNYAPPSRLGALSHAHDLLVLLTSGYAIQLSTLAARYLCYNLQSSFLCIYSIAVCTQYLSWCRVECHPVLKRSCLRVHNSRPVSQQNLAIVVVRPHLRCLYSSPQLVFLEMTHKGVQGVGEVLELVRSLVAVVTALPETTSHQERDIEITASRIPLNLGSMVALNTRCAPSLSVLTY